jgi:formylmethanofuran dehydrogenase subunit E
MGYQAARAGLAWLEENRAGDEEIVAIVETNACGTDAIQVVTGCTFGKGNLFFRDFGKSAFSFLSRATGRGIRLYARPGCIPPSPEHLALMEKVADGTAGEEDLNQFADLHRQRTLEVLRKPASDLFGFKKIVISLPPRAQIRNSQPCSRCGESTMDTRLTETKEGLFCRPCLEETGQRTG